MGDVGEGEKRWHDKDVAGASENQTSNAFTEEKSWNVKDICASLMRSK